MTEPDILAELYFLGVLEDKERDAVSRRIDHPENEDDHELAAAVVRFGDAFFEADLKVAPVAPSLGAKARLENMLDQSLASKKPAFLRGGSSTSQTSRTLPWRGTAITAIAASLLLTVSLFWQVGAERAPLVLTVLLDETGRSVAVIEAFSDNRVTVALLEPTAREGAQVLQVWTKPDPNGPPVSLGILRDALRALENENQLPQPATNQFYEITIEPAGGSPTGLPTGPIVGKGLAQQTF